MGREQCQWNQMCDAYCLGQLASMEPMGAMGSAPTEAVDVPWTNQPAAVDVPWANQSAAAVFADSDMQSLSTNVEEVQVHPNSSWAPQLAPASEAGMSGASSISQPCSNPNERSLKELRKKIQQLSRIKTVDEVQIYRLEFNGNRKKFHGWLESFLKVKYIELQQYCNDGQSYQL